MSVESAADGSERRITAVLEVGRALSSTLDHEPLLKLIMDKVTSVMHADRSTLFLLDEQRGELWSKVAQGTKLAEIRVKVGQGVAGWVAKTGRFVNLADAHADKRFNADFDNQSGYRTRSLLCWPVRNSEGQLIAVVEALNKLDAQRFSESDEEMLAALTGPIMLSLENARLHQAAIRESQLAAIGHSFAAVLHDLRTPMTVISGYAQLMAMSDDPEVRQNYCDEIQRQFELLNAMTREVLAFARGEMHILVRKNYMQSYFDEIEQQLQAALAGRNVELEIRREYKGIAWFDPLKMMRVIQNLAKNAAEAMPEGGKLTVGGKANDEHVILTFTDTGRGVPEEIRGRLFEPFATSGKEEGTGLGLAIVKKIVGEHGGSIDFKSTPKGTTFEVRLPREKQPTPIPTSAASD